MHASISQQQQNSVTTGNNDNQPDQKVRKTSDDSADMSFSGVPSGLKHEDMDEHLSNMPPVIEEGLEPPHPNVLPT